MSSDTPASIDIVGDIHGQLRTLEALLDDLDYRGRPDGSLTHPEGRRLVFLGDLVDRGPHSFEVADRVRRACLSGEHLCLLGNHELNLVEWRHGRSKAKVSNRCTIEEIEAAPAKWAPILDFFETLPVALELASLRVTHAVWHQGCFGQLEAALTQPPADHSLTRDWAERVRLHSPYTNGEWRPELSREDYPGQAEPALEVFLKGYETEVAAPFIDNDGRRRQKERARWWLDPNAEVARDKRVVFGHYWNLPPILGHHDAHAPPFASGHPELRAWTREHHHRVEDVGRSAVGPEVLAVCVDYNGVTNAGVRACVGAYRHPESEVVWRALPRSKT